MSKTLGKVALLNSSMSKTPCEIQHSNSKMSKTHRKVSHVNSKMLKTRRKVLQLNPNMSNKYLKIRILAAWPQIWAKPLPKHSFLPLWQPWPRYGQIRPQRAYFSNLEALVLDIARMSLRGLILPIWVPSSQLWAEWAPEGSFWTSGSLAPRHGQNESQGTHFDKLCAICISIFIFVV